MRKSEMEAKKLPSQGEVMVKTENLKTIPYVYTKEDMEKGIDRATMLEMLGIVTPTDTAKFNQILPPPDYKMKNKGYWKLGTFLGWLRAGVMGQDEMAAEKLRKTKLEADVLQCKKRRLQIQIDSDLDRTLPADEVEEYGRSLGAYVRSQCQSLGASVAVRCAGLTDAREVQQVIDDRMRSILDDVADWRWDVEAFRKRIPKDDMKEDVVSDDGGDDGE